MSLPIFRRASLAIDDFGATAELAATVEVEDWNKPYPASEFDITKLNTEGWSGATNTGSFVTGLTFEGRSSVVSIGKAETNLNGNALIMNNYSSPPSADLSETPYMLVDYYYRHDASSTKNAASQMR